MEVLQALDNASLMVVISQSPGLHPVVIFR
jgi:hypothetical protein